MSAADPATPPSAREQGGPGSNPEPATRAGVAGNLRYFWAGILVLVAVGGVALGLSLSAVTRGCTSDASGLPLQGTARCDNAVLAGTIEAVVAAAAFLLGVFLLVHARVARVHRIPVAVGILMALVLVVAESAAVSPTAATIPARPQLSFPMPAGTTFSATQDAFAAFAEAAISADPYVPWAPIELQGGWNATSEVCLAVVQVDGSNLGPGVGVVCGTTVTFVLLLAVSTYVFAFYVPSENTTAARAQVVITSDVHIVY